MVIAFDERKECEKNLESYELVILGAGPAGLTAAIYAGRYHINTLVIANVFGGTANLAGEVENWPGFKGSGVELMKKFKEQAESFDVKFLEAEIKNIERDGKNFVVCLYDRKILSKSLIVALGTEHRKLNIKGEREFLGRGVSYCATCDGNFFKSKDVAVIGGADSAAKAALYLSSICNKVYIIYRRNELRCEPISFSRICEKKNIEIYYHSQPLEIIGDKKVKAIRILVSPPDKNPFEKVISVDGIFVEIGAAPASDIVKNLGIEFNDDYIKTDKMMRTNVEGVFAAGDITDNGFKQIVTAAGEGAIAARSAYDYLIKLK